MVAKVPNTTEMSVDTSASFTDSHILRQSESPLSTAPNHLSVKP